VGRLFFENFYMEIRDAVLSDAPAIAEIYGQVVEGETGSFETVAPTSDDMAGRIRIITQAGFPYLVAELDGAILGYCYASAYRAREAYRHTVENSVYISKAGRGKGVGKALLEMLLVRLTDSGFKQVIAVIGDADNAGSIGLHAACGFEKVGQLKQVGHKHGQWLDVVLMQKTLDG